MACLYVLAEQFVQAPASPVIPAWQPQMALPGGALLPVAPQARHEVEPGTGLYLPSAQSVHEDAPDVGLYLPAAQSVHEAFEDAPGVGLYLPGAQSMQDVRSTPSLKEPARQEHGHQRSFKLSE